MKEMKEADFVKLATEATARVTRLRYEDSVAGALSVLLFYQYGRKDTRGTHEDIGVSSAEGRKYHEGSTSTTRLGAMICAVLGCKLACCLSVPGTYNMDSARAKCTGVGG